MTHSAEEKSFLKKSEEKIIRPNWLFEIEPYSRTYGESLTDLRDNIKMKKIVKRAIERDIAPAALIQRIQTGIRA